MIGFQKLEHPSVLRRQPQYRHNSLQWTELTERWRAKFLQESLHSLSPSMLVADRSSEPRMASGTSWKTENESVSSLSIRADTERETRRSSKPIQWNRWRLFIESGNLNDHLFEVTMLKRNHSENGVSPLPAHPYGNTYRDKNKEECILRTDFGVLHTESRLKLTMNGTVAFSSPTYST